MTEKTLTTENIKPALDALRGELAPWPVVAKKQDRLNTAQLNAANSGITSSLVAQIIANTAAIRALESAITGTGLRALVVSSLPAVGTTGILYIVPVTTYDPDTDADVVNYSNEYIWIPVEGGTASEGHYEQVGQTGIVINNGQLTITVNGTSVGTFTANQSGDTTAAITVPTNADYVDRTTDQTVAGVKTFSSTINGTAAKAIADEDGTSIKTGYVNVAGNQTITGQKTWSGNQFFTSPMYPKNTSYEIGNTPASNVAIPIYFTDKVNVHTGYVRNVILTTGKTQTELLARNKFTSGALSPTGTDVSSTLVVEVQSDGTKSLYFDGSIRNNVLPYATDTYNIGSSSYQWSSVYAQTYYYNGTAWGLDKNNTWTGSNTFTSTITTKTNVDRAVAPTSDTTYGTIICRDKNGSAMFRMQGTIKTDLSNAWDMMMVAPNNSYITFFRYSINTSTSDRELRFKADSVIPDDNSTSKLGTSTNQWSSVYAQSYYYNGTAWGLDKANVWSAQQIIVGNNSRGVISIYNPAYTKGGALSVTDLSIGSIYMGDEGRTGLANSLVFISTDIGSSGASTLLSLSAMENTTSSTNRANLVVAYDKNDAENPRKVTIQGTVIPHPSVPFSLGTSTNKWKTLNGVNPGALSLPDLNNTIDITSTFNTSIDKTQTVNSYTADFTGWLFINWWTEGLTNPFYVYVYCTNSATDNNLLHAVWGQSFSISGNVDYMLTQFPVISGKTYWFVTNFSRASTDTKNLAYSVRKLPCLGNV